MSSLQVQLLGKISILNDSQTIITVPAKAQELFFYLLLHGNRPHERELLSTVLWPDLAPDRAKKYFRQALWQLQTTLNQTVEADFPLLILDGNWVQLDQNASLWLDTIHISQTFEQVRDIAGQKLTLEQATSIQEAVILYQGELLTGWYQDWCVLERERYQSIFLALLDKLIDYCMSHDQIAQGIDYARRLLQYDKARERTHRRLMRLYYLAHNRTAALRQFEQCQAALAEELGVAPSKRTTELYQQIQADQVNDLWQIGLPSPSLVDLPTEPSPSILNELRQIQARLVSLQLDIQSIKYAANGSKDAPTDAEIDASIDASMLS